MTEHAVSIIGAGNMGHGFAAHFTIHGQDVTLIDHRESNLEEARERIEGVVAFLNDEGLADHDPQDVVDMIEYTTDLEGGVSAADVVLETVPEDLDLKHDVFTTVAAAAPPEAILATNTSSLPITDVAEGVPGAASRIVGCHWLYPPYLLEPVEVIRGEATADETIDRLSAFVEAVERAPIHVERDVPGFVINRFQRAVYRECLHMVEEGVASIEDINRIVRDGYAVRTAAIGPFETIDIAGLDQILTATEVIQPTLCNDTEPSRLFSEYLERGRGGIDDGAGFLDWNEPPEVITSARDRRVAAVRRALSWEEQ